MALPALLPHRFRRLQMVVLVAVGRLVLAAEQGLRWTSSFQSYPYRGLPSSSQPAQQASQPDLYSRSWESLEGGYLEESQVPSDPFQ